jgi:hypothetical protein
MREILEIGPWQEGQSLQLWFPELGSSGMCDYFWKLTGWLLIEVLRPSLHGKSAWTTLGSFAKIDALRIPFYVSFASKIGHFHRDIDDGSDEKSLNTDVSTVLWQPQSTLLLMMPSLPSSAYLQLLLSCPFPSTILAWHSAPSCHHH